ncbi:MAG TPA: aminotransferase class V-fold PLP-dependent enzyme [Solirubrobacteraceae bacterium]|nr:aminotransferase class V-fold PLP-dependent enzyme [Solirubrobacteraceae bacterium]
MADEHDVLSAEHAAALDAADPLRHFRDRFVIHASSPLYVDGNSLGRLPHATAQAVGDVVAEWGSRLVTAWPDWIDAPQRIGDLLAPHVLGARPGEVLACDSTTVNLFKLADAVLTQEPGPVVVLRDDFPTDRYVLEGLAAKHGVPLTQAASVAEAREHAERARLVVLSAVDFRTGALTPLDTFRGTGARVIWDLSHAAGAVELDLHAHADLAVGCSYKYLNGGPGAPAWLYVRTELQDELSTPIQGWFGQRDQFAMGPRYEPAPGIDRFLAGTPPILALAAVRAGVELTAEAGMPAIAAKHRALTEHFVALADAWLTPLGFAVGSPRDPGSRGGHVSLTHPRGWQICRALIEQQSTIPDFREPDVIRFAFPALYTSFAEVREAARRTRDLVASGAHEQVAAERHRVT